MCMQALPPAERSRAKDAAVSRHGHNCQETSQRETSEIELSMNMRHTCDCLGCAVLLCLVVCLTLLASFVLPSASLINMYMWSVVGSSPI